ncbi:histidinol-phosphate transaminase [Lutimonas saemankumensis]|uniref:histidinol-phosphate transaminase n=1 Tax=Lutimonas saemankumensis TaxID=483016 RepID=UPI001CD81AF9|nr:histidinol-phosphate transaminase [Lutimonas saemankumensis]MCA0931636.1 histidinol-phosphate transaminase [Lutimonas saemankumensis]
MKRNEIDIMNLARPSVKGLKPYASAKDEFQDFDQELIYLDANENPYENGLNRYPDPHQMILKKRISTLKGVPADRILLGNGSDEILDMIFRVFFEPGEDNIIINTPTFGMFKVLCGVNNVEYKEVSLTKDFQLDPDKISEAIDANTKAIFICSPNNPTGNLMKKEAIKELLSKDLLVIIDEAYIDFSGKSSWNQELENYKNLIVTQTFSKAYGLAGIRLGVCYADPEVITLLKKVKMPYNINILTQKTALKQLEDEAITKKEVAEIVENRKKLAIELSKINLVKKIYPSDSNFLLVKVDDADRRYKELIGKDLVIRNRSKEPLCENCLRITVGTPEENKSLIKSLIYLDTK